MRIEPRTPRTHTAPRTPELKPPTHDQRCHIHVWYTVADKVFIQTNVCLEAWANGNGFKLGQLKVLRVELFDLFSSLIYSTFYLNSRNSSNFKTLLFGSKWPNYLFSLVWSPAQQVARHTTHCTYSPKHGDHRPAVRTHHTCILMTQERWPEMSRQLNSRLHLQELLSCEI